MAGGTNARAATAAMAGGQSTVAVARRALAVLSTLVLLACTAPAAHAGTYTVHICDPAYGNVDHATTHVATRGTTSSVQCGTDLEGREQGIRTVADQDGTIVPGLGAATASVAAPGGTTISAVDARYIQGHEGGLGWVTGFQKSTDRFYADLTWAAGSCSSASLGCGTSGVETRHWDFNGITGFRTIAGCVNATGCRASRTSPYPNTLAYVFAHVLNVTLRDDDAPALLNGRGAAWNSAAWHRGVERVGFDASDATGVSRMRVEVFDGTNVRFGWPIDQPFGCDFTYLVPCSNHGYDGTIDTRTFDDGTHTIRLAAADAAGNWRTVDAPLHVDNHAPGRVGSLAISGGEGWTAARTRTLDWTNPAGQVAPITTAHVRVCKDDACQDQATQATGAETATVEPFAGPGDYTIQVFLRDAAGNEDPGTMSDPVHMRFDDVPPEQATPQHRNGWVNRSEAGSYVQHIDAPLAARVPVSGVDGYSITTDGSTPDDTIEVRASRDDYSADARLGDLDEGVTRFRARAVSGAGVASPAFGTEDIHVDMGAPDVSIHGQPDPNRWSREAVWLNVVAAEPTERSGMAGAESADPADDHGAFIGYVVDGGAMRLARGPERAVDVSSGLRPFEPTAAASVPVTDDGSHTVTYSATDVAGNESQKQTVVFKIDRTAPELVVFEPQEQEDPQRVTVAASDATSGLADGATIQLRQIRPTAGDWITLRTTRAGQRYSAHVDNRQLPQGDYQFRATVPDAAGNEATGDHNRAGHSEVLHIDPTHVGSYETTGASHVANAPDEGATVATRVSAGIVTKTVRPAPRCSKAKRRRHPKQCRATTVKHVVPRALIAFGKRATVTGALTTAEGQPLAGREVVVFVQNDTDGAQPQAESSIRTDSRGQFRYLAPAGPSRVLDLLYRGDPTYKHSDRSLTIKVPASATIKGSRRKARNGQSVNFSGRLLGQPYPAKGKVLDLQAFYRGKWRTFATPRASLSGRWHWRYRFEATRGRVVYRFRVRVWPSSDYPYQLGYSRAVKVTVRG